MCPYAKGTKGSGKTCVVLNEHCPYQYWCVTLLDYKNSTSAETCIIRAKEDAKNNSKQ